MFADGASRMNTARNDFPIFVHEHFGGYFAGAAIYSRCGAFWYLIEID